VPSSTRPGKRERRERIFEAILSTKKEEIAQKFRCERESPFLEKKRKRDDAPFTGLQGERELAPKRGTANCPAGVKKSLYIGEERHNRG